MGSCVLSVKLQRVIAGPLFPESWLDLDAEVAAAETEWQQEQAHLAVKR
jgi:hypothetical protein